MTATQRISRLLVPGLVASSMVVPRPAGAQTPPASAPVGVDGMSIVLALGLIALFGLAIVVGVKLYDWRLRLADEDMMLEARVSDVLMSDPTLAGFPVAAHVERTGWSETAPTHVEVTGTVTSPLLVSRALKLVTQEVLPVRPSAKIESHLDVDPAYRRVA